MVYEYTFMLPFIAIKYNVFAHRVYEWIYILVYRYNRIRYGVDTMDYENREHDIYFAGGCFWGVEKYFSLVDGVVRCVSGYANGKGQQPTYKEVCNGSTGFVECVHVTYDPTKITLSFLLCLFYEIIDPTSLNSQGNDVGTQYRTGIYYTKKIDKLVIEESLSQLQAQYQKPLVVECLPLLNYYLAEEYHQTYLQLHPNGYCHISPSKFDLAKTMKCCRNKEKEERFQKRSEEDLRFILSDEQFAVTQENATEPPFKNLYWNTFEDGIYIDVTTGEPLFVSCDKFESGCGWPSFSKPITNHIILEQHDSTHGMLRREVRSTTGNSHLGHVFEDGPSDTGGLRYCINSSSLKFIPKDKMAEYGYSDFLYLLK